MYLKTQLLEARLEDDEVQTDTAERVLDRLRRRRVYIHKLKCARPRALNFGEVQFHSPSHEPHASVYFDQYEVPDLREAILPFLDAEIVRTEKLIRRTELRIAKWK